jgi:hypothetical protein
MDRSQKQPANPRAVVWLRENCQGSLSPPFAQSAVQPRAQLCRFPPSSYCKATAATSSGIPLVSRLGY